MRLKAAKRKDKTPSLPAAAFLLIAAAVIGILGVNSDRLIPAAGEKAAMLSAALNMPDGGLKILAERFRSEIFNEPETPEESTDIEEDYYASGETPWIEGFENDSIGDSLVLDTPLKPPKIPDKFKAALISENFAGHDNGSLIKYGAGFIKNDTKKPDESIAEVLEKNFSFSFSETGEPQVLLLHTHATESFERFDSGFYDTRNTWRSTDNNNNMAAVGAAMRGILEENGIGVIHDTTQHDYPSYNGSYERSAETVKEYLEEFPSIKVVLDLHRDAMERDNQVIVKPVAEVMGKKAAQIMIISGCDDGSMNMPNWRENLRFASALESKALELYPGLMRPVYLCYRKYNMDLLDGYLLLEFGSNANTLNEAVYSAKLFANALTELIMENTKDE